MDRLSPIIDPWSSKSKE
jgi:hypothetical protein